MTYYEEPREKKTDGMEDLFEVNRDDILDTDDVIKVDMDRDIMDSEPDGSFDDLTTVDREDVVGNVYGQSPLDGAGSRKRRRTEVKYRLARRIEDIYPGINEVR